jgi:hypothetical protein
MPDHNSFQLLLVLKDHNKQHRIRTLSNRTRTTRNYWNTFPTNFFLKKRSNEKSGVQSVLYLFLFRYKMFIMEPKLSRKTKQNKELRVEKGSQCHHHHHHHHPRVEINDKIRDKNKRSFWLQFRKWRDTCNNISASCCKKNSGL